MCITIPLVYSGNVIQYGQKKFLFHCYSNAFIGAATSATDFATTATPAAAPDDDDDDDDSDGK